MLKVNRNYRYNTPSLPLRIQQAKAALLLYQYKMHALNRQYYTYIPDNYDEHFKKESKNLSWFLIRPFSEFLNYQNLHIY